MSLFFPSRRPAQKFTGKSLPRNWRRPLEMLEDRVTPSTTIIDNFGVNQSLVVVGPAPPTQTGNGFVNGATTSIIGGQREAVVTVTASPSNVRAGRFDASTNTGAFSTDLNVDGALRLVYDGNGDAGAAGVNLTGLGGVNFAANATGFDIVAGSDLGATVTLTIYSGPGGATVTSKALSVPANTVATPANLRFNYSDFGAADFSNVGAIVVDLDGVLNADSYFTVICSSGTPVADLGIVKTQPATPPRVNEDFNYTLTLTNNGPDLATGVQVTDVLPTGLTFVSASASQGSYANGTGIWTVGNLASNQTVTLTVTARLQSGFESVVNTATVTGEDQTDNDKTNNTSTVTTTVSRDFGDAPNTYSTKLATGARHARVLTPTVFLGTTAPDAEADGQPNAAATGDGADEDGVTFGTFTQGQAATVTVTSNGTGKLDAFIDWNLDGDFADAGEQVFTNQTLTAGANNLTVNVPAGAVLGNTYARFRVSTAGGLTFNGFAADGEVEDYRVGVAPQYDYGDAPDTYGTLLASSGARHAITNAVRLGATVDSESDGQPNAAANGDGADEDGVAVPALTQAAAATFTVTSNLAGSKLDAFIDWNGDGDFADAGEQVFASKVLAAGANSLTVNVPTTAKTGNTYARFRISTAGGLTATGTAADGEVEDYQVNVAGGTDFGDAPATYGSASHTLGGALFLGAVVDSEAANQPSANADGDNTNGTNDEEGVTFGTLTRGTNATVTVVATAAGKLDAWIDFNANGSFDAGEQVFASKALSAGSNTLTVAIPGNATAGATFARFRVSTAGGQAATGTAADGEVEDYAVTLAPGSDFGDAPANYGIASHTATGVGLGATRDAEAASQFSANADGDGADEDGVTFGTLTRGTNVTITVTATAAGKLDAFIDFNADGDFADAGEKILNAAIVAAGANTFSVAVPGNAAVGATFARFRVSTAGGLGATGAAPDGEVEDYTATLAAGTDFGDAPSSYGIASHTASGVLLGTTRDAEAASQFTADATGDGADEDGVTIPALTQSTTATVSVIASGAGFLNAWIDWNADGDFADAGEQIATNAAVVAGANSLSIAVPAGATTGTTFARFRVTSASVGSPSPTGAAADGEVEDFTATVGTGSDFGDAPASYGVASHTATGVGLGALRDVEAASQFSADATGDNTNGSNDEEGVSFGTLTRGTTVTITVTATAAGKLDAFIDFNADGDFADAGEKVLNAATVAAGSNTFSVAVPGNAAVGGTFARFRVSTAGGLGATGAAPDGEVEDYAATLAPGTDFGDAPSSYGIASHTASGVFLGTIRDAEAASQFSADATGDGADEDGVSFGILTRGTTATVTVTASAAGKLDAFIDFNADGDFADAGEQVFANTTLAAGSNSLTFAVPGNATAGATFARFRVSTAGGLGATGAAADGEVEDYAVTLAPGTDFGDAPSSYGIASHTATGVGLGATRDAEAASQFSADATGDGADEDGVSFGTLTRGTNVTITVTATAAGKLDAFIDFNADGDFADAGEKILNAAIVAAGANTFSVAVPGNAAVGATFARFRVSTAGGLGATGAAADGEVEDYAATLAPGTDFGDAPSSYGIASHTASGVLLGTTRDAEAASQFSTDASGDGADEDGVAISAMTAGTTTTVTGSSSAAGFLSGWIDWNGDGDFNDAGELVASGTAVNGAFSLSVSVPFAAKTGATFARFRVASSAVGSPTGAAADGEVEDYAVAVGQNYDFGDAPDTYGTTLAANGAAHVATGPTLGATRDAEADGQPTAGATGDGADEDGVTVPQFSQGQSATFTISAPAGGKLDLFVDWNRDGDFADAGERVTPSGGLAVSGTQSVTVLVPLTAGVGATFVRARLSTAGGSAPIGFAADGEVEDSAATILNGFDFGDAPDTYGTTLAANGPRHRAGGGLFLGTAPDIEADGQPTPGATGDGADEDGVTVGTFTQGTTATVTIVASAAGKLDGWIDFNGNGTFDAADQVFAGVSVTAGTNTFTVPVPSTAKAGATFGRFRLSTAGGLSPTGPAADGEVEDYAVTISAGTDFGDAPASYGVAGHTLGSPVFLGAGVDGEAASQFSADATGDNAAGTNDETGVTFNPLTPGVSVTIDVSAAAAGSKLDAFFDWNRDGDFADAGEQVFASKVLAAGANSLTFTVPGTAATGTTFARFRVSTAGGLTATGTAPDGEVEDYAVGVGLGTDYGDAPASYGAASHTITGVFLGAVAPDAESTNQPSANATGDNANGTNDEDGVTFGTLTQGSTATISVVAGGTGKLDAWIDLNGDGDFADAGEQVAAGKAVTAGANTITFTIPATAKAGATFARFRVSSAGGTGPTGLAPDGEVEDYAVTVAGGTDFGDAPGTYGVAGHTLGSAVFLGAGVDSEAAGQPNGTATGDDAAGTDDEDGVAIGGLTQGQTATITVTSNLAGSKLDAFFDWNRDGDFADAGEQVFSSRVLAAGANTLTFTVPAGAASGTTFGRFRVSTAGGLGATGIAPDGEVEDYAAAVGLGVGTLGDFVFEDVNGNGTQDGGEPGVDSVAVDLYDAGGTKVGTTTTAGGGAYSFPNIVVGDYSVVFTRPAGYAFTIADQGSDAADSDANPATGKTAAVTVVVNQTNGTLDAGLYRPATLGDIVFLDTNANGVQDSGEVGRPGVAVNLYDGAGTKVGTTTTVAGGAYQFVGLAPGAYVVEFLPGSGLFLSPRGAGGDAAKDSNADPVSGKTAAVTLASGGKDVTIDAGVFAKATLGDFAFTDANGDGVFGAGDTPLAGVVVTLLQGGVPVGTPATTGADGKYTFAGLIPGTYAVRFAAPAGLLFTTPNAGADDAADSDADPTTGTTTTVVLASGETNDTFDAGFYRPVAVGDFVFDDANGSGTQDAGEAGVGGVIVTLYDARGAVVGTPVTTGADGLYRFTNVIPGTYTVGFALPAGTVFTPANVGADAADSDADPVTGKTAAVVVVSGADDFTIDAGTYRPATIGDFVFDDGNGNGTQDAGEPGVAGVAVTLFDAAGKNVGTTTTGPGGKYAFTGLAPGAYAVGFAAPAGYSFTKADAGGNDATDSDADPVTGKAAAVVLASGAAVTSVDAGLFRGAALGDFVFLDANGNGVQDAGEAGVGGMTVNLFDAAGKNAGTTTTRSDGAYAFAALTPGDYSVRFTAPAGFVFTGTRIGGDAAADSDANADGTTNAVTLASGQTLTTIDAGVFALGAIGDTVWLDANGNGTQDAGEPGLGGVAVTVTWGGYDGVFGTADDKSFATVTGPDGKYGVAQLPPGAYQIRVDAGTLPAGVTVPTFDADGVGTPGVAGLTLTSGQTRTDGDFGYKGTGSLGDLVWYNPDGNTSSAGEPGLPNVTVTLVWAGQDGDFNTTGDNLALTTTTDKAGGYAFTGLPAGTFRIATAAGTLPAGLTPNYDADGTGTANAAGVTLAAGESNTTIDFGYAGTGTLRGVVFRDDNNDGTQNPGEPGIGGVTVVLTGTDEFGVPVSKTAVTGADGSYGFTGLAGGAYTVSETQPAAYNDGRDAAGTLGGTVANDVLSGVTLPPGEAGTGYTFGEVGTTISGTVYLDTAPLGTRVPTDPGLGGIVITLLDGGGNVVATTTTGADGGYQFNNLPAGTYTVTETQPGDYGSSTANTMTVVVPITGSTGIDFGETLGGIAGVVFRDDNDNGTQNPGEPGIGGTTVTITGTSVSGRPVAATTTTAADGTYVFTGLPAGTYTVNEIQPPTYTDGRDAAGTLGGTAGNDVISGVVLPAGTTGTGYTFGELGIVDLAITETVSDATPILGGTTVFTVVVTNNGPADDTGVTAAVTLPPGTAFVSSSTGTGTYNSATGIWTIGDLPVGGTVTLAVVVRVMTLDVVTVPSVVTGDRTETNTANNAATASAVVPVADLQTIVTVPPGVVTAGTTVDVTYAVINRGPTDATGVSASFPLPAGVTLEQVLTTTGGTFDRQTGLLNIGNLPNGGTATVTLRFRVTTTNPVTFTSVVGSDSFDPVLANNPDRAAVPVGVPATDVTKQLFLSSTPAATAVRGIDPPAAAANANNLGIYATGADAGNEPRVTVFDRATGQLRFSFNAYDAAFRGGVRVALGDVTGDGVADVITAPGEGGGPEVKVFDGRTGAFVTSFDAYESTYKGGVYVAVGDVNGDGVADIVTGTGNGGGPRVRATDVRSRAILADFFAYESTQRGGVNVAAGDLDGDGKAEIVAGAGIGGGPRVRAFRAGDLAEVANFFAYDSTLRGGVFVSVGDTDGDGRNDIITGAGAGGGPNVRVFDARTQTSMMSFFAGDPAGTTGARVAAANIDMTPAAEIITATGSGTAPRVRTFSTTAGRTTPADDFLAFDEAFLGGVFVDAARKG